MQAINTFVTLFAFAMAAPATVPVPPVCLWEVNNLGATVDVGTSLFLDGVHVSCGTTSKPVRLIVESANNSLTTYTQNVSLQRDKWGHGHRPSPLLACRFCALTTQTQTQFQTFSISS